MKLPRCVDEVSRCVDIVDGSCVSLSASFSHNLPY